jgi:OOP family OmpA-OmpF porin
MLGVPNAARAESGRLNLHLDLGAGVPIVGPEAVGSDGVDSVYGGVFLLGVDYQLAPPFAIELLGGGGFFTVDTPLGSDTSAYGSVAIGARFRFMDNHEGYMNEEGGDSLGNFWVSAHIGWHHFDGEQFGIDVGAGYEWSVVRPLQIGLFVRATVMPGGDDSDVDGIFVGGVNFSLELIGGVSGLDTDGDGLTDERELSEHGTDPGNPDSDGDGISDGVEVHTGTQPMNPDTDADGAMDGAEDANHDGVLDATESDPRVPDSDGGGVPDGFEAEHDMNARDASDDDSDHDGVLENIDRCPGTPEGAEVNEQGCVVLRAQMVLPGIEFGFDSADILPQSEQPLRIALQILRDNADANVEIGGHTDNQGASRYNMRLSLARANSVRDWLVDHGIDRARMSTRGYGASTPTASNDTDEGRARNRRIEFKRTN